MSATYTYDVYSTLDGFGSFDSSGDWGAYWGKEGPELLQHRLEVLAEPQRLVLGGNTFRMFARMLGPAGGDPDLRDPVNTRMVDLPTTVVSSTLTEPLDWPDATLVGGDAVEVVARLKEESDVPLRSHGSVSMNRELLSAGLVDRIQVTIFPAISGRSGTVPVLAGTEDFDLTLLSYTTLDGRTQELVYAPSLRR